MSLSRRLFSLGALKDLENEIYGIKRANEPLPIEMIRMRAVLLRARGKSADP